MMRKLVLLLLWFPTSVILLIANLTLLHSLRHPSVSSKMAVLSPLGDISAYNLASPANTSVILGTKVVAADARGLLLGAFLKQYESPLAPYANFIVDQADKNGIDFRLVVAIAMCESNLGKYIPKNSFNAWGIAVYDGQQTGANFSDWPTAIQWVSQYLRERYIDKGFKSLKEIGAVYAPPSVATGYSWTHCVEAFQNSIF